MSGYDVTPRCALSVARAGATTTFAVAKDFVPIQGSASSRASGGVVFVGYGISDDKYQYDDYAQVNVRGKIVVCLWHEPFEKEKHFKRFDGAAPTAGSFLYAKGKNAEQHGAAGLLVFTDPLNHKDLDALRTLFPYVPGGQFKQMRYPEELKIPVAHASARVADLILGEGRLLELQKRIDAKGRTASVEIPGVDVTLETGVEKTQVRAANVVGVYRGADESRAKEVVVVGGHYDHVGVDGAGQVFHGADDNGSGTSCILEVVDAFGTTRPKLARTVVFIAFAGEEKGLKGSAAYCEHPFFPLDDTILMINIDMIGRGRPLEIDVPGITKSPDVKPLLYEARRLAGARIKLGEQGLQYFERSDQWNFYRKGVPALFFLEPKEHEDYHQITDTQDKVLTSKVAEVAKVVFGLSVLAADAPRKPARIQP
ncbi:MAG: M20/M25/M40 family metallo-hydrolase [Planctomycetota bacterium]